MATSKESTQRRRPPARTAEARENQLGALAYDLAEKQLRDGTAKSQVITHFLKAASVKERRELMLLEQEIKLKEAKTKAIESEKKVEELYEQAILAMRTYSGQGEDIFDD